MTSDSSTVSNSVGTPARDSIGDRKNLAAVELPEDVRIRQAESDDFLGIMRVLDAAVLRTDSSKIRQRLGMDVPLVFVAISGCASNEGTPSQVIGAVVIEPDQPTSDNFDLELRNPDQERVHIAAVAVRRHRQNRGIGRALVQTVCAAAKDRLATETPLQVTVDFDPSLRPFYAACGFEIHDPTSDVSDRLWGIRHL